MLDTVQVAKHFLGDDDYCGIDQFFEDVLTSDCDFRVAMARRCFNLYYALKENGSTVEGREVISDNALLLYAHDFAKHFIISGRFPSVLLIDDILLHGRAIYNALYRMEERVFKALKDYNVEVTRRTVHESMYRSVDIRVYAMGDTTDVIDDLYLFDVSCANQRYGSEMLQLLRDISRFLSFWGGPNTSFLLSTQVDRKPFFPKNGSWTRAEWRRDEVDGAALLFGRGRSMRLAHVLTCGTKREGLTWVTGFPCTESIAGKKLNETSGIVADWLEGQAKGADKLVRLLRSEDDGSSGYKMSLMALIESAESLVRLCDGGEYDWEDVLANSDLPRISRNFGKGEDLYGSLKSMLSDVDSLREWTNRLYEGSDCVGLRRMGDGDEADDALFIRGENLMCGAGMKAEMDAFDYSHRHRTFVPLSSDSATIALGDFLDGIQDAVGKVGPSVLACQLSLQHRGIYSMEYAMDFDDNHVHCLLKASELAMHTFPERHRYVLPALAYVEMATRTHPRPLEQTLSQFVRSLPDDDLEGVPMPSVLGDLKRHLLEYAHASLYIGKGMVRWSGVYWGSYVYPEDDSARCYKRLEGPLLRRARDFAREQMASL